MVSERRGDETLGYISNSYINFRITSIITYFRIVQLLKKSPLDTTSIVKKLGVGYSTSCRFLNSLMFYGVIKIKLIGKNGRRVYELTSNWETAFLNIPNVKELLLSMLNVKEFQEILKSFKYCQEGSST